MRFGSGDVTGLLTKDSLHVGPVTVKNAGIAMVRNMSGEVFQDWPFHGILGLAFSGLSHGAPTYLDEVVRQGCLASNEFAFYFNTDRAKPSVLLWGGVDEDLYHGPIHMFPVVEEYYWAIGLVDFKIGDESMLKTHGHVPKSVIIDSGTTYFTAPETAHAWIASKVEAASCSEVSKYPAMTFVLKDAHGQEHELRVSQNTYMVADQLDICRPAWMQMTLEPPSGDEPFIIGEVFMRHFFTVFHRGDGTPGSARVGFAPAKLGKTPSLALKHGVMKPSTMETKALPKVAPAQKAKANKSTLVDKARSPGMARVQPLPSTKIDSFGASVAIDAAGDTTNVRGVPGRKQHSAGAVIPESE